MARPETPRPADTHEMVAAFEEAWAHPRLERFLELLDPEVCLRQPVTPTVHGLGAAREEFSRLLRWLPDLRGTIDSSAVSGEVALVAWRLRFTLGRAPFELRIVDRLVVRNGRIVEREAYFDSLRFFLATLARPSAWGSYLRYRGYLPG